ncbi:MAG TPA: hypothetical protein VF108_11785 [Actinomycetota bacterium]
MLRADRETRFLNGIESFMRRDFDALGASMHRAIRMEVPGSSWLAGTYRGYEAVGRCLIGLRRVLDSSDRRVSFVHENHRMVVQHVITVRGPRHEIDMTLTVSVSYDHDDRARSISIEPDDPALFDHVIDTVLERFEAS